MVDALASGASTGNGVEVRVLSWAPILQGNMNLFNALAAFRSTPTTYLTTLKF